MASFQHCFFLHHNYSSSTHLRMFVSPKFSFSCRLSSSSSATTLTTSVDDALERSASDRNAIRLGLPSKGRLGSETLDLLKVLLFFSLFSSKSNEIRSVFSVLLWILFLFSVDLIPSSSRFFSFFFSAKDCQLSVMQVNPRQYVADIPQVLILPLQFLLIVCCLLDHFRVLQVYVHKRWLPWIISLIFCFAHYLRKIVIFIFIIFNLLLFLRLFWGNCDFIYLFCFFSLFNF